MPFDYKSNSIDIVDIYRVEMLINCSRTKILVCDLYDAYFAINCDLKNASTADLEWYS